MGKAMVTYSPYARTWYSCRRVLERVLVLCPLLCWPYLVLHSDAEYACM